MSVVYPAAAVQEQVCFHCGLPVPNGASYAVTIDGAAQPMCCRGCEAVAAAIVAAGLEDFYRHRRGPSKRGDGLPADVLRQLALYDRPEVQRRFVRAEGELREASLILEGIDCAACGWLNERHVSRLPGVAAFHLNYSTHRALVAWDPQQTRLSDILEAIAAIGYRAHPYDPRRQESVQRQERAAALRRIGVAGVGAMQVMMLAVALYAGAFHGMDQDLRDFLRWMSLLIAVPVAAYAARPFFAGAWRSLRNRTLGMDVPVVLAITGALLASAWHTWRGHGEVYFDSATMFTFFLLTARYLEMAARHRAGQIAEELVRLLPDTATRIADGREEAVAVAELVPGDRVLIRPGETVPADGRVSAGRSSVDEALLTGESLPVAKAPGDALMGGSVNVASPLEMTVDKVGPDTLVSAIARLLDRAQSEKPRLAQLADWIAARFVAGVLVMAAAVFAWWWLHDPAAALPVTLAVLVVTCPCALSLATPAALTAATGSLTRLGLLVTRSHALETLARTTHVVFDKTGTLTYGQLRLAAVEPLRGDDPQRCLELAAALERGSEHPIGQALRTAADGGLRADEIATVAGQGVEGWIDGRRYRLGTPDYAAGLGGVAVQIDDAPVTVVALGDDRGLLALFRLADSLRPEAAATVQALRNLGLEVCLYSGDRPEAVAAVARQLDIQHAEGALRPADKLARVKALQERGAVVAMVGDGVNDAPTLAAAPVSIAMGGGTQLAQASADLVLLAANLERVAQGVHAARRTLAIIRQNLAWAIAYNLLVLPLAAAGWIAPWMAALGMSFSSLLVVANALRLRRL